MKSQSVLFLQRKRRAFKVRKKSKGTIFRPRLSVCRSLRHISCQIIDDTTSSTLVSASTLDADVKQQFSYGGNKNAAAFIGKIIAEKALAKGISAVCFDRGKAKYHGRVAALADAARAAGLSF